MIYTDRKITGVTVEGDKITPMGVITMTENLMAVCTVTTFIEPLIRPEDPKIMTIRSAELEQSANLRSPKDLISSLTSEVQKDRSGELVFRGSRTGDVGYYVDGVRLIGNDLDIPGRAIGSLSVYTGGVPAKYGDITGGIVVIETKSYFDL